MEKNEEMNRDKAINDERKRGFRKEAGRTTGLNLANTTEGHSGRCI